MAMKIKSIIPANIRSKRSQDIEQHMRDVFQPDWYVKRYPAVAQSSLTPFEHYLQEGDAKGLWPSFYFDPGYYRDRAPGARKNGVNALEHYVSKGWRRDKNPSRNFSLKLYFREYPNVHEMDIEPLRYHLQVGKPLGRLAFPTRLENQKEAHLVADMRTIQASNLFDAEWYQKYYSDLWFSDLDPLYHYVKSGWKQDRQPNMFFDPAWYKKAYAAEVSTSNPLMFYIQQGFELGHNPSETFCNQTYLQDNKGIVPPGAEPLAHYLTTGMESGVAWPSADTRSETSGKKAAEIPLPKMLRTAAQYSAVDLAPARDWFNPDAMNIHWVVPSFSAGAGGHMTIFRMMHFLELAGHKQTLWVNDPKPGDTPKTLYHVMENHFQHFTGEIKLVDETLASAEGDAIIATDCWTVYPVLACAGFQRRFYFVQDFEPSFHPMGASYLLAEQTYREDLDCLCASPWLAQVMTEKYGRWANHFWLAADTTLYQPPGKRPQHAKPRIAVYARHFTERRAVELAYLALESLANQGYDFVVDFFGASLPFKQAMFPFVDHGVASQEELADIFKNATVGLVFSATNYSLVPQEMMACGLPIVELDVESTRAIFPANVVTMAQPVPDRIAEGLATLLDDPEKRDRQADEALAWVRQFSWQASAAQVETSLKTRLGEFAKPAKTKKAEASAPKASVIIPTMNAGKLFDKVLGAVVDQAAPWPFEILVIDSGSTDETLEIVKKYPSVRLHQIDKSDFDHGATRNLGATLTSGEFIAYITHDAMPYNASWLYNLVTSIEKFPGAAGAFGKHVAWPDASPFTKRDLKLHFDTFAKLPLAMDKDTNVEKWKAQDPQWQQTLHFYSDNNSCFRRSIWEKIPYRATAFGEDQLWAWDIIKAGYQKVYAPQAVVHHSHDYDADETFERSEIESAFFKHFFGYTLMENEDVLAKTLKNVNKHDEKWAKAHGISPADTEERKTLNAARLKGYLAGSRKDTASQF